MPPSFGNVTDYNRGYRAFYAGEAYDKDQCEDWRIGWRDAEMQALIDWRRNKELE